MKLPAIITTGLPVYVTRKNGSGMIASWEINALLGVICLFLIVFNIMLWGVVGCVEALDALGVL